MKIAGPFHNSHVYTLLKYNIGDGRIEKLPSKM